MFFVGVTRFSLYYPNAVGWNLTQLGLSNEEYEARLFDEKRLDPRWWIFSQLSVPQLALGSERFNYRHIVQISPELPEKFKESLKHLACEYKFLVISEESSEHAHSAFVEQQIRDLSQKTGSRHFALFRLDDDDVLADNYFRSLATYVREPFVGLGVSFGRGFQVMLLGRNLFNFRRLYQPRNSMGLALIGKVTSQNGIVRGRFSNHARCDLEIPTVLDSRSPLVLSIKHRGQDSLATGQQGEATHLSGASNYLEPTVEDETVLDWFSRLKEFTRGVDKKVIFDGRPESSLSTYPEAVRFNIDGPSLIEIAMTFTSQDAGDDKRFFISLPFQPDHLEWPWKKFQHSAIVAGIPFNKGGVQSLPLKVPAGVRIKSASFWQSRAAGDNNSLNRVVISEITEW